MADLVFGYGLCECGCGQKTTIASRTDKSRGAVKGEPRRFVRSHGTKNKKVSPDVIASRASKTGRKCHPGCTCKRHDKETHRRRQTGVKRSPETRAKMSAAHRARHAADPEMTQRTREAMWNARVAKGFKMPGATQSERLREYRSTPNGRAVMDFHSAKRRQIMLGLKNRERFDRMEIFHRDGGICQICGEPANPFMFHVDHIVPISRGGAHNRSNVQTAHPWCNLSKGAKMEFAA